MHDAAKNGYLDIIKNMIKHNGNVLLLNRDRKAPLDIAIDFGHKATVDYLTEMEALQKQ